MTDDKNKTTEKTKQTAPPVAATPSAPPVAAAPTTAPVAAAPAAPAAPPVAAPQSSKKMTASQRLTALEDIFMVAESKFGVLADELDKLKNMITGLSKKLNASIEAAEAGNLTKDSVNKIIVTQAAKELADRVTGLVEAKVLEQVTNKEVLITNRNFVVGREIDDKGTEINPRVQFALSSLDKSLRDKILGHKLGDLIDLSSGNINSKFEVTELYKILEVKQEKKFPDSSPEEAGTKVQAK